MNHFQQNFSKKITRLYIKLEKLNPGLRSKLQTILDNGGVRHLHVRLARHPTIKEKRELANLGINLHGHLGSQVWRATLTNKQALTYDKPASVKSKPTLGLLRAMHEIQPKQKVTPLLLDKGVFPKHRHPDGSIEVRVGFYGDVSVKTLDRTLCTPSARVGQNSLIA